MNEYGYFTDAEGNILGPDDPIVYCSLHRQDESATIIEEAHYVDDLGNVWDISPGDEFDGASVPRFFRRLWSPFQARIRDIASFHDVYCVSRVRSQRLTHRMYWSGLLSLGGCPVVAFIHWLGIRIFCRLRYWRWK